MNQVETWRNSVRAKTEAIPIDQLIVDSDCCLTIITTVAMVVIKLAGTRKEQIATQLWRENSNTGSKLSINLYFKPTILIIAQVVYSACLINK